MSHAADDMPDEPPRPERWRLSGSAVDRVGAVRLSLADTSSPAAITLRFTREAGHHRGDDDVVGTTLGHLRVEGTKLLSPREAAQLSRWLVHARSPWVPALLARFPHLALAATGLAEPAEESVLIESLARGAVAGPFPERFAEPCELTGAALGRLLGSLGPVRTRADQHFTLEGFVDAAHGQESGAPPDCVLLRYRDGVSGRSFAVLVGPRGSITEAFVVVDDVALAVVPAETPAPSWQVAPEHAALVGLLATILATASRRGLELRPRGGRLRPTHPFVLTMRSECGQACQFCTLKDQLGPRDRGATDAEEWRVALRSARARGFTAVQLDGLDPARHSHILDLVRAVRELGFSRLIVTGTGRRLADAAFRRALFSAAPDDTSVLVPLYGVSPATHDAVTGAPGSFSEAMEALVSVRREYGARRLIVGLCATPTNIDELAAVVLRALDLGATIWFRLPYPHDDARREGFARAAVRESLVVERFVEGVRDQEPALRRRALEVLASAVSHPCVLLAVERATGVPAMSDVPGTRQPQLHGAATVQGGTNLSGLGGARAVPCAEADRCALAGRCSRAHLEAYVQRFGTTEFRAVPALADRAP